MPRHDKAVHRAKKRAKKRHFEKDMFREIEDGDLGEMRGGAGLVASKKRHRRDGYWDDERLFARFEESLQREQRQKRHND